jgi:hypothetical protein
MDNDFKQNQALMLVATLGASFATITAATPSAFARTVPATDQSAISEDQVPPYTDVVRPNVDRVADPER